MLKSRQAVKEHLEIFRLTLECQPKLFIAQHSETLGGLFLRMFDLRRIQLSPLTGYSYEIAEIEWVEDIVNDCAVSMVCKLNDITFRPMFLRMLEWTTCLTSKMDMKATIHRQTTWYKFLIKFFGTLKVCTRIRLKPMVADIGLQSIVTNYAALITDGATEILRITPLNSEDTVILWRKVILTLQRTFENDHDGEIGPWHPAHIES